MAKRLLVRLAAFVTAMAMLTVGAGSALADTAYNTIDGSIDTNLEVVNFAAGATAAQTVTLRLTADSSYGETDPQNGCTLGGNQNDADLWQGGKTGTPALKLTATSSSPSVATVTSPLAFTDCANHAGYERTLNVTPVGPGSTTVTFAIDTPASKWRKNSNVQLSTASFTVNVASPPDPCASATAPAAPAFTAGAPNGDNGWFKATAPASVPAATATSTTSGVVISYSTDGATFSSTVPTLSEGITTVTAKAAAATCASKFSTTARTFKIDTTAPSITDAGPTTQPNANNWYKTAVTNTFNASDGGSGLADCTASFTKSSGANEEGSAVKIASGACSDLAGNTNAGIDSAAFKIDMTAPGNITFVGGPSAGAEYYFGAVPAAPTCTADDMLSLLNAAGCTVSGYSAAVGNHTMTAGATDNAGNLGTAQRSYKVLAWTVSGFYSPVDMNTVPNVVKAGSTVPLKFEIFSGTTELTDVSAIDSFTVAKQASCSGTYGSKEAIGQYSTGGTALRYDATGGQFIQNWKIPSGANTCYRVTMTADDGSSTTALFRSK